MALQNCGRKIKFAVTEQKRHFGRVASDPTDANWLRGMFIYVKTTRTTE